MWKPIDENEWPKNRKILVAYKNKLGNWRRVCATYYEVGTLNMSEDCDPIEADDDGMNIKAGWFEDSETQEYIWPTDCAPLLWHPLPDLPSGNE